MSASSSRGLPLMGALSGRLAFVGYVVFVLVCLPFYAPYGFENNDSGFILAISRLWLDGASLYDQVVYVRPPMSVFLHALCFLKPFAVAPILVDRAFVVIEVATYAGLSAWGLGRLFGWLPPRTLFAAILALLFSLHNFPPMAWHTIDGVFFSVIAVSLLFSRHDSIKVFLALLAALAAALCKQSFYPVPILVFGLAAWMGASVRILLASALLAVTTTGLALSTCLEVPSMLAAITAQTTLQDFIDAGLMDFLRDLVRPRALKGALLLGVATIAVLRSGPVVAARWSRLLLAGLVLFLGVLLAYYAGHGGYGSPLELFDALQTYTFVAALLLAWRTRQAAPAALVVLHAIAWCAAISWGYKTTALYFAPAIITVLEASRRVETSGRAAGLQAVVCLLLVIAAFTLANRYTYSLEGEVTRASQMRDLGSVSPVFRGLKVSQQLYALYADLEVLSAAHPQAAVEVLPNMPLAEYAMGRRQLLGVVWPLNAEVGNAYGALVGQLDSRVDVVFVHRGAAPAPLSTGRFGSRLTQYVLTHWQRTGGDAYFDVYTNPAQVTPRP